MLGPFELAVAIVVIGGTGGTLITIAEKALGTKRKQAQLEAKAAQDRARTLAAQLLDAERQNEQLQQQLAWHARMLETQDRLVRQLADGPHVAHSRSERQVVSAS
jgi:hypothetical protein